MNENTLIGSVEIFRSKCDPVTGAPIQSTTEFVAEGNNSLFSMLLRTQHSFSPFTGLDTARITFFEEDDERFNSDAYFFRLNTSGRIGEFQSGMVSPSLELDADGYPVIIVHNRFAPPAAGQTRTIQYIGLTIPNRGVNRDLRSYVRLHTPCIQTDTEILDIYYRIKSTERVTSEKVPMSVFYMAHLFATSTTSTDEGLKLSRFPYLPDVSSWSEIRNYGGNGTNHAVFHHRYNHDSHFYGRLRTRYQDSENFSRWMAFDMATGTNYTFVNMTQSQGVGSIFNTLMPLSRTNYNNGFGSKPQQLTVSGDDIQGVFINNAVSDAPFLSSLGESTMRVQVEQGSHEPTGFNTTHIMRFATSGSTPSYELYINKNIGFPNNAWGVKHALLPAFHVTTRSTINGVTKWKNNQRFGSLKWYGSRDGDWNPCWGHAKVSSFEIVTYGAYNLGVDGQPGFTYVNLRDGIVVDYDADVGVDIQNLQSLCVIGREVVVFCKHTGVKIVNLDTFDVRPMINVPDYIQVESVRHVAKSSDATFMVFFNNGAIEFDSSFTTVNVLINKIFDVNHLYSFEGSRITHKPVEQPAIHATPLEAYQSWCTEYGLPYDTNLTGMVNGGNNYGAMQLPFSMFGTEFGTRVGHSTNGALNFFRTPTVVSWGGWATYQMLNGITYQELNYSMADPLLKIWVGATNTGFTSRLSRYQANANAAIFFCEYFSTGRVIQVAVRTMVDGTIDVLARSVQGSDHQLQVVSFNDTLSTGNRVAIDGSSIMLPLDTTVRITNDVTAIENVTVPEDATQAYAGIGIPLFQNLTAASISRNDSNKIALIVAHTNRHRVIFLDKQTGTGRLIGTLNEQDIDHWLNNPKSYAWTKIVNGDEWFYLTNKLGASLTSGALYRGSWNTGQWRSMSSTTSVYAGLVVVPDIDGNETIILPNWTTSTSQSWNTWVIDPNNFNGTLTTKTYFANLAAESLVLEHLEGSTFLLLSYDGTIAYSLGMASFSISFKSTTNAAYNLVWDRYGWVDNQWVKGDTTPRPYHSTLERLPTGIDFALVKPTGVETAVAGEYVVFNVCDGLLKDNSSTLSYTTTFGVGNYQTYTESDINLPIIPSSPTPISNQKIQKQGAFKIRSTGNVLENVNFGTYVASDFDIDYLVNGRYSGMSQWVGENATKFTESCDLYQGDFTIEMKLRNATTTANEDRTRIGFVRADVLPANMAWNADTVSYRFDFTTTTVNGVRNGLTAFTSSNSTFPRTNDGDIVRISRVGTTFTFTNVTTGLTYPVTNVNMTGPLKLVISNFNSSCPVEYINMVTSYDMPVATVPIGKLIDQSGVYSPSFSGLAAINKIEVDGIPFTPIYHQNIVPPPGQVVVLKSGYLRFNPADAGKTITSLEAVICDKYY